jgi:hypothetical protein
VSGFGLTRGDHYDHIIQECEHLGVAIQQAKLRIYGFQRGGQT